MTTSKSPRVSSLDFCHPLGKQGTIYLNEFSSRLYPKNTKELFNLRYSSLRVTVERASTALKNRFKILDLKPFHTFSIQVKLVLACCILHNYIIGGVWMSSSWRRML
jgi:hypothetical protein